MCQGMNLVVYNPNVLHSLAIKMMRGKRFLFSIYYIQLITWYWYTCSQQVYLLTVSLLRTRHWLNWGIFESLEMNTNFSLHLDSMTFIIVSKGIQIEYLPTFFRINHGAPMSAPHMIMGNTVIDRNNNKFHVWQIQWFQEITNLLFSSTCGIQLEL